jgi:hypothetical protein
VATGAAGGSLVRSRLGSLPLGLLLHLAGDRIPHEDIPDRHFRSRGAELALKYKAELASEDDGEADDLLREGVYLIYPLPCDERP